jgi:hypothetical protein
MAVVFDYSDKLNTVGPNPRSQVEIEFLLLTKLWKVPLDKDGSASLLYTQLCQTGAQAQDVHVLCPPYCAYKATNAHLFGGNQYFVEWLIVACNEDTYLIVLHTKKQANGICTSDIDHISGKNPKVELYDRAEKIKPFVTWWLNQCTREAQPAPANTAPEGPRFPPTSAAPLDHHSPAANATDVAANVADGPDNNALYLTKPARG